MMLDDRFKQYNINPAFFKPNANKVMKRAIINATQGILGSRQLAQDALKEFPNSYDEYKRLIKRLLQEKK